MTKLEKLIKEHCPNGVEYICIDQIFKTITAPKKLNRKEYKEKGSFPIIDQGQNFIIGYTDDKTSILPKDEYIIFGEHTRIIKYVNFPFAQGADGLKILVSANKQMNTKYLYYAFSKLEIPSRGYNRHWSIVKDLCIPIPPLLIQQEIVRILDKYIELDAELEKELQDELEARKKQYEYYRNELLTFNTNSDIMKKTANSQQPTANSQQPTANSQQPT